jgi:hypothetical protein
VKIANETKQQALARLEQVVLSYQEALATHEKSLAKAQDAVELHEKAKTKITLFQARAIRDIWENELYAIPMPSKLHPGTTVVHKNITSYCLDRFCNIGQARVYQLINWANIADSTKPEFVELVSKLNEWQIRALAKAEPEDREKAFQMMGTDGANASRISEYLGNMGDEEYLSKLQAAQTKAREKPQETGKGELEVIESIEAKLATVRREARRGLSPRKAALLEGILNSALLAFSDQLDPEHIGEAAAQMVLKCSDPKTALDEFRRIVSKTIKD